jgi:hypothetical protein
MPLDPWQCAAAEARTAHELLNIAREFIATFTPGDLASIPESCRPPGIKGTDDLHHWQQRLAEAYCAGAARAVQSPAHSRLLSFLTIASDRALALAGAEAANDGRGTQTFQR